MDLSRRLDRYRRFYADPRPGGLLINIGSFGEGGGAYGPIDLRDFDFSRLEEHRRYWDMLLERNRAGLSIRAALDDDHIPGLILHYGFGAFGAVYCDLPLTFTDNTSYMGGYLEGWDDLLRVRYDPNRWWSRVFREAAAYLSEQARGEFLVDVYPNPSPLDAVNLVMGNALFAAVYEEPRRLHQLLDQMTGEVLASYRAVSSELRSPWGGALAFNAWIPQGILLLEDAADLCSPAIYAEFGRPYTARVVAACGGGYIHHHSLGRQQYRNMATIPGLTVLQISSDPNCVRPALDLGYLVAQAGIFPCDLECTPEEIREGMAELQRGRFILRANCASRAEAEDLIALVRGHSRTS
jgi:hypothetical protein